MAINKWQAGTIYIAGSLVIPTAVPGATSTVIENADFESGDQDWTKGTGWAINANLAFNGTYSAEYSGPGAADLISTVKHPVSPGKAITASCFAHQGASDDGQANVAVILRWYTAGDVFISDSTGNSVSTGAVGVWRKSSVEATAPPTAAKVSIGCTAYNDWAVLNVDNFAWNYVTGAAATGLAYKAIGGSAETQIIRTDISFDPVYQPPDATLATYNGIVRDFGSFTSDGFVAGTPVTVTGSTSNDGTYVPKWVNTLALYWSDPPNVTLEAVGASITLTQGAGEGSSGLSGPSEPIWPTAVGETVADNEVIWEAVGVDSVTWEASSILTSGGVEPTWPTEPSSFVSDNNIAWETVPLRIEDENCPHTKVVAIAASKVFAGDTDIVRFCATLNARDWSSEDDAGFLPSGLQQKSQVGVDAMGVYRGNLAVWSASTFQVWQVDPDPSAMALLDAMEGIGSIHQQAVQPVSDDLFFLAALGVRTVSIAEGANNLAAGDVGVPIDTLVQVEANAVDVEPVASYYPSAGQYWLAFRPLTIGAALLLGQFLLTSPIYPLEVEDAIVNDSRPNRGRLLGTNWEDAVTMPNLPNRATLKQGMVFYPGDEDAITGDNAPEDSLLGGNLIDYTNYEDAITGDNAPEDSTKEGKLITYDNYEDAITGTNAPEDSTLV